MMFSYDGSQYAGFQKQKNKSTVQSEIEQTLFRIFKKEIKIVGSGRTDSGVHARAATCHFDIDIDITDEQLKKALNLVVNKDIYINEIKKTKHDFHARFDVKKKKYLYLINTGQYNVFEKDYVYQLNKKLDLEKMKKAIKYFEGTHDFESFCKKKDETDFTRTIYKTNIKQKNEMIYISFIGNGFLRYMVRNMVGSLIEVGLNKKGEKEINVILEKKDRKEAGLKAPAEGLYLEKVYY